MQVPEEGCENERVDQPQGLESGRREQSHTEGPARAIRTQTALRAFAARRDPERKSEVQWASKASGTMSGRRKRGSWWGMRERRPRGTTKHERCTADVERQSSRRKLF